jgi:hypothetical protein
LQEAAKGVSDIRQGTSLVLEDGETFVAEWKAWTTNIGALPRAEDVPAGGKLVENAGVSVARIRHGKFSHLRDYYDVAHVMGQMGLMPNG